jgi:methyl-accepting chemotaxis protein
VIGASADRRRLDQLARGLIAYGVIGIVIALAALIVLGVGLGRVGSLADRLGDDVDGVSAVVRQTGDALDRAVAVSDGFGGTIDNSTAALGTAAEDLRAIVPQLRDIESQANAINILGTNPFSSIAGLFGRIAGQLDDLDQQLDGIATSLGTNRQQLEATSTSLGELANRTQLLATRLAGDEIREAMADLRWLLVAMLGVGAAGAAVPAVGALLGGLWLRRSLAASAADATAP